MKDMSDGERGKIISKYILFDGKEKYKNGEITRGKYAQYCLSYFLRLSSIRYLKKTSINDIYLICKERENILNPIFWMITLIQVPFIIIIRNGISVIPEMIGELKDMFVWCKTEITISKLNNYLRKSGKIKIDEFYEFNLVLSKI